jgi:hypothetical protein
MTAFTYRGIIDNHIVPLGGKLKIDRVTQADVERIMRSVEEPPLILIEPAHHRSLRR